MNVIGNFVSIVPLSSSEKTSRKNSECTFSNSAGFGTPKRFCWARERSFVTSFCSVLLKNLAKIPSIISIVYHCLFPSHLLHLPHLLHLQNTLYLPHASSRPPHPIAPPHHPPPHRGTEPFREFLSLTLS